jgi:hypothetical protein
MYWVVAVGLTILIAGVAKLVHYFKNKGQSTNSDIPYTNLVSIQTRVTNATNHALNQTNRVTESLSKEAIQARIELAQSFEIMLNGTKRDPVAAFNIYLEVAKEGSKEALVPLERLGEEVPAEQQLKLSDLYLFFKNDAKANYWNNKAQEVANFKFL